MDVLPGLSSVSPIQSRVLILNNLLVYLIRGNSSVYVSRAMNLLKKTYLLFLIAIACQEPFDFDSPDASLVVLDAKVSTMMGETSVTIYSTSNEEVKKRKALSGFEVSLVTGTGVIIDFEEGETRGVYRPIDPNFIGEVGQSYRLSTVSPDDHQIISQYDSIHAPVDFELTLENVIETELNTETNSLIEMPAIGVFVDLHADREDYFSRFTFRYEYDHFFTESREFQRPVDEFVLYECRTPDICDDPAKKLIGTQVDRGWSFWDSTDHRCDSLRTTTYVAEHPNGILAAFIDCAPDSLAGVWLDPDGEYVCCCCITFEDYETEFVVIQETLSNQSYRFWQNVDRLLNNDGLVFDTFPFPVTGNVSCENCPFTVVGQLRAVAETRKSQSVLL